MLLVVWLHPSHRLARVDLAGGAVARQAPCGNGNAGRLKSCGPKSTCLCGTPADRPVTQNSFKAPLQPAGFVRHGMARATAAAFGRQLTVVVHKPHLFVLEDGQLAIVPRAQGVEEQYCSSRGWRDTTSEARTGQAPASGHMCTTLVGQQTACMRASCGESKPPHSSTLTRPIAGIKQRRDVWSGQRANIIRVHEVAVQVGADQGYLACLVVVLHLQAAGGQARQEHACRQGNGSAAAGRGSKPP